MMGLQEEKASSREKRDDVSNSWEGGRAFLRKLYFYRNTISGREELVSSSTISTGSHS